MADHHENNCPTDGCLECMPSIAVYSLEDLATRLTPHLEGMKEAGDRVFEELLSPYAEDFYDALSAIRKELGL